MGGDAITILDVKNPGFASTCYRITASVLAFTDLSNWPKAPIGEVEARLYLDKNDQTIDEIEGIWNTNDVGTIRVIQTWQQRNIDGQNSYRIFIRKDTSIPNYEYAAYVLESRIPEWRAGFLKARFRKTAYPLVFDGLWYRSNFIEEKQNNVIDEDGLMRSKYATSDLVFKYSGELTLIKAYPPFSPSQGRSPRAGDVTGSGFFVSPNGILATNAHLLEGAKGIEVCIANEVGASTYKAKVLLSDKNNGVALLQIDDERFKSYPSLPYGFLLQAEPGEKVFTIGFPLNDIMGINYKVTDGIISSRTGIGDDVRYFQITVPLQPGNCGGPLFNRNGFIIGLTSAKLNSGAVGVDIENVNYAIKASYLITPYNMLPSAPKLNSTSQVANRQLEEQVRVVKNYVCLVKVRW